MSVFKLDFARFMYVFKLDSAQLLMEFIPVCYNYIVRLVLIPLLNHPHHV
jgi:hypothetical protein